MRKKVQPWKAWQYHPQNVFHPFKHQRHRQRRRRSKRRKRRRKWFALNWHGGQGSHEWSDSEVVRRSLRHFRPSHSRRLRQSTWPRRGARRCRISHLTGYSRGPTRKLLNRLWWLSSSSLSLLLLLLLLSLLSFFQTGLVPNMRLYKSFRLNRPFDCPSVTSLLFCVLTHFKN